MPAAQAVEAAAAARAASAGGRTDGPAPPSDEELLESARRHAALQVTFSPDPHHKLGWEPLFTQL